MLRTCSHLLRRESPFAAQIRGTVIVERWWQIPLSKEGKEPYLHPRRHRIYRLVEDTKHRPKEKMELILTQNVHRLGSRGDTVLVDKRKGRGKLLPQGLAVYSSPENKAAFEEERRLQLAGELGGRAQTWTGEMTVAYLKKSWLRVEMKSHITWQLTEEIVARQLLKNLRVVAPVSAVKIPDEPITTFGEYWCEVTVNGIDTVRMPMKVIRFKRRSTKQNLLSSKQSPAEGSIASDSFTVGDITSEPSAEGDTATKSPPEGGAPPKSNTG